jgi:hypothetical protein
VVSAAAPLLGAKDPIVRRCGDFFAETSLVPSLDSEAMRTAERGLWAKITTADAG